MLRDFAAWLTLPLGLGLQRQLKNLARFLPTTRPDTAQAVVLLGAGEFPTDLARLFPIITLPLAQFARETEQKKERHGMKKTFIAAVALTLAIVAGPVSVAHAQAQERRYIRHTRQAPCNT